MNNVVKTATHLSLISKQRQQPLLQNIEWQDTLDDTHWAMSPEFVSLYGTAFYDALSESQQKHLALLEAVNFFSLNIHGERYLVSGIMQRIHREQDPEVNEYLHHFIDEENKHMAYFAEFCQRYAGFIYQDRSLALPRKYAPGEEDFLFYSKALIFEELVDAFNAQMGKDTRLHPVARQINELHHLDESRHRAFGRRMVVQLFKEWAPFWSPDTLRGVRSYLAAYLQESWKSFYNPDVYRDLEFKDPLAVRKVAMASRHARELRQQMSQSLLQFFTQHEILREEIEL